MRACAKDRFFSGLSIEIIEANTEADGHQFRHNMDPTEVTIVAEIDSGAQVKRVQHGSIK